MAEVSPVTACGFHSVDISSDCNSHVRLQYPSDSSVVSGSDDIVFNDTIIIIIIIIFIDNGGQEAHKSEK